VEVWCAMADVAKSRRLEHIYVGWIVCHVEAPFIDLFGAGLFPIILHDAELSETRRRQPPTPLWQPLQPVSMNVRSPWRSGSERASAFPARYSSKRAGVIRVRS